MLLNKLIAPIPVNPEEYKNTFYQIGKVLSLAIRKFLTKTESTMLACASEDADWLARGILDGLSINNPALAVFWTDRYQYPENQSLVITPIIKSYIEDVNNCKTLIIVKSIIVNACVVKTQLSHLIEKINPENIIITAPVMFKDAEQKLRDEFPMFISNKFSFISLVTDDQINENGEVIPGIGGMVYSRLGFGDIHNKNKYIPEIVKLRREL